MIYTNDIVFQNNIKTDICRIYLSFKTPKSGFVLGFKTTPKSGLKMNPNRFLLCLESFRNYEDNPHSIISKDLQQINRQINHKKIECIESELTEQNDCRRFRFKPVGDPCHTYDMVQLVLFKK